MNCQNRIAVTLVTLPFVVLLVTRVSTYWRSNGDRNTTEVIVPLSDPGRVLSEPRQFALSSDDIGSAIDFQLTSNVSDTERWSRYECPVEVSQSMLLRRKASHARDEAIGTLIAIRDLRHQTNERCFARGYPRAWNGDSVSLRCVPTIYAPLVHPETLSVFPEQNEQSAKKTLAFPPSFGNITDG
jgi:hypothetical protein